MCSYSTENNGKCDLVVHAVALSVCLSVCFIQTLTFESLDLETSFFGMKVLFQTIFVKVEYQGSWVQGHASIAKYTRSWVVYLQLHNCLLWVYILIFSQIFPTVNCLYFTHCADFGAVHILYNAKIFFFGPPPTLYNVI